MNLKLNDMEVSRAVNIVKSKGPMIEPWETSERTRKRGRIIKNTLSSKEGM